MEPMCVCFNFSFIYSTSLKKKMINFLMLELMRELVYRQGGGCLPTASFKDGKE